VPGVDPARLPVAMRRGLGVLAATALAAGLMAGGLAPPAHAATGVTVYADPAGAGTACTAAAPCPLSAAVAQANGDSGDTVLLAGGTYTSVALQLEASMTLAAAPGAHPVLQGQGQDFNVVEVDAGTVTVSGLTVTAGDAGIQADDAAGPLTVTGSTIIGNSDPGIQSFGSVTVTGSTLAANSAGLSVAEATLSVTNTTITGNDIGLIVGDESSASVVGATISDNGQYGVFVNSGPGANEVSLGSSLITGNGIAGCTPDSPPNDAGYNVESDNSCGLGSTSRTGVTDAAIGLGPLAANGSDGPQTQAIGPSSAAFHIVPAGAPSCPGADERGAPRPGAGTACDAGAFEYQAVTLAQAAPTSGTVAQGTAFSGQLAVTGAAGTVSYATTSPAGPVTVSPAGVITAPASTPAGV
jgi:hypothetical protein